MATGGPILAAVDLSEISPFVVRSARALGVRLGAPLRVVHCAEGLTDPAEEDALLPALRHQVDAARRGAEAELEGVLSAAGLEGEGAGTSAVVPGEAAEALPAEARRLGARLVVVGAPHPDRAADAAFHELVRRCDGPVLVVRHAPPGGYRRVLVGIDFSETSANAWALAVSLAHPAADLIACHATTESGADREAGAQDRLEAWLEGRPGADRARAALAAGPAKAALLEAAAREGADLVALGRRRHRGLAGFFLGAVWETVAGAAACDVAVTGGGSEEEP